jgi:hypothetical protein
MHGTLDYTDLKKSKEGDQVSKGRASADFFDAQSRLSWTAPAERSGDGALAPFSNQGSE